MRNRFLFTSLFVVTNCAYQRECLEDEDCGPGDRCNSVGHCVEADPEDGQGDDESEPEPMSEEDEPSDDEDDEPSDDEDDEPSNDDDMQCVEGPNGDGGADDEPTASDDAGLASGTRGDGGTSEPTRAEGPEAACPFPELDAHAIQLEELYNPENEANGVHPAWYWRLEFGTRGGLLRAAGADCEPTEVTGNENADCSEGYDCGGCPLVLTHWSEEDVYYLGPEAWELPACAPFASYNQIHAGTEEPVHACDVPFPEYRCQCAEGEAVSLNPSSLSMSGLFCSADDEEVSHEPGTHDWCTHTYVCATGEDGCEAYASAQIDRATGDVLWGVGNNCLFSGGDVYEAETCPDVTSAASGCSACIEACAGVPECECDAECDSGNTDYSCAQ